jgi:glycosyltransferase involved in cell wall biosynthesis
MERVLHRPFIKEYKSSIFIPNPEWLDNNTAAASRDLIDTMLHKTLYSFNSLQEHFPEIRHHYVGFTSNDPGKSVRDFKSFSHFRGLSAMRHTDTIIRIWQERPSLPHISVQLYDPAISFEYQGWLSNGNISIRPAFYNSKEEYFDDLTRGGMHLCTSEVEGFGHYINESRAMSAATIVLDAPPMNEFFAGGDGILVPASSAVQMEFGVRYRADQAAIEDAIERMLSLDESQRAELGKSARNGFEADRQAFHDALSNFVNETML